MNLEKLNELAQNLPDTVKANALALIARMGEVIEGIGDEPVTWHAPMIKLVQAMTERAKIPKGAVPGDLLLGERILERPIKTIPIRTWTGRQYWSPDQNETKMLCSSPDGKLGYIGNQCGGCPHQVFDEEAKKSECSKIVAVMSITADLSEIFITNFAKTGYKTGLAWQSLMKKAGVATYRRVYSVNSIASKEYKNVENIDIQTLTGTEKETPADFIPFLTELFNQIGADRTEMLTAFYKMIDDRKSNPALAIANGGADSEVVLIGTDVKSDITDVESKPVATSSLAKKYQV